MPSQNSGSLSAAGTRGRRRGRREGTLAWPAAATSYVVFSAMQAAANLDDKRIRGGPSRAVDGHRDVPSDGREVGATVIT